jgi:curli production assembly/transport component CsgF
MRASLFLGTAALGLCAVLAPASASAQELVHRFINPSFGGNPFYSDHLFSIAGLDRPDEPEEPAEPPQTEGERIAEAIRARLLANLQSDIQQAIERAQPGQSGTFEVDNQRISFVKTTTETRVTFVNTTTGETRQVVIPVRSATGTASASAAAPSATANSAERALGAATTGAGSLTYSTTLGGGAPLEPPVTGRGF